MNTCVCGCMLDYMCLVFYALQHVISLLKYIVAISFLYIKIEIIEFVQIASNTLFTLPIGTYNFHDDTAVVRNLQDVTNSSAHHNPRMTRIVQTV